MLLTTQYLEEADRLSHRIAVVNHGQVIAEGTPDELKHQVGGHRLEIRLADEALASAAAQVLAPVGSGPPVLADGVVSLPIAGAAGAVTSAVRRLDEAEIAIDDITTHHPTLDDVFLTLTGQTATDAEAES